MPTGAERDWRGVGALGEGAHGARGGAAPARGAAVGGGAGYPIG